MKLDKDNKKLIIYGVGVVAGYFLIIRPILVKLGLTKSNTELQSGQAQATYFDQTRKNYPPTKSDGEWAIVADQIYEDLRYSYFDDNKADAQYQVSRVKNEGDVVTLIKFFGKRQEYLFGIPSGSEQDLQQFIKSNLSTSAVSSINDNYSRKGIKYRF